MIVITSIQGLSVSIDPYPAYGQNHQPWWSIQLDNPGKKPFRFSWNGKRFSRCHGSFSAIRKYPDAYMRLWEFMAKTLYR